jgi:hypothetical protein
MKMTTNNKAVWQKSLKTWAHALTKSQGARVLTAKEGYTLALKVSESGNKVFTLTCGNDAAITVDVADHGGADSVRSIADQLCERLAARSGVSAPAMQLGEGAARKAVALNLDAVAVKGKAPKSA